MIKETSKNIDAGTSRVEQRDDIITTTENVSEDVDTSKVSIKQQDNNTLTTENISQDTKINGDEATCSDEVPTADGEDTNIPTEDMQRVEVREIRTVNENELPKQEVQCVRDVMDERIKEFAKKRREELLKESKEEEKPKEVEPIKDGDKFTAVCIREDDNNEYTFEIIDVKNKLFKIDDIILMGIKGGVIEEFISYLTEIKRTGRFFINPSIEKLRTKYVTLEKKVLIGPPTKDRLYVAVYDPKENIDKLINEKKDDSSSDTN